MTFKRNITFTLASSFTEWMISFMPAILIMVLIIRPEELEEALYSIWLLPLFAVMVNMFLLLISLLAGIFMRTRYVVKDGTITKISKKEVIRIPYEAVDSIHFDLGMLWKYGSIPSELVLCDKKDKILLSVKNPSVTMVHLIRKKCKIRKVHYENGKRFLWSFLLMNGAALVVSVIMRFFA